MRHDRSHQEIAVAANLDARPDRRDAARGVDRHAFVAAGGQPGRFAGRVDTADLHRYRGDTGQAEHQHDDQRGDRQRRLDGARTGTAG